MIHSSSLLLYLMPIICYVLLVNLFFSDYLGKFFLKILCHDFYLALVLVSWLLLKVITSANTKKKKEKNAKWKWGEWWVEKPKCRNLQTLVGGRRERVPFKRWLPFSKMEILGYAYIGWYLYTCPLIWLASYPCCTNS